MEGRVGVHGHLQKIGDDELDSVLRQRGQTAVMFLRNANQFTTMQPLLERQEEEADVHLAMAMVGPESPVARQYRIGRSPTLILFENGRAQRRLDADQPEGFSEDAVRKFLR